MTTPFWVDNDADFTGAAPDDPALWMVGPKVWWMGRPDTMMIQLPRVMTDGYTVTESSGEVEHGLAGGMSAVTRFQTGARRYTLPFARLASRDREVLHGFYRRLFGNGPWAFLPPEDVNRLTLTQSMCGLTTGVVSGWNATAAPVYTTAVTAPIFPCGVMQWAGATNALLTAGAVGGAVQVADLTRGVPLVAALPVTFTMWARSVTGTASIRPVLLPQKADGTSITQTVGATVSLTTAWRPLTVTVQAGALTGQLLSAGVQTLDGAAVYLSNPQLEYAEDYTAWAAGRGVPRVVWVTPRDLAINVHATEDVSVTLAESVPGAC